MLGWPPHDKAPQNAPPPFSRLAAAGWIMLLISLSMSSGPCTLVALLDRTSKGTPIVAMDQDVLSREFSGKEFDRVRAVGERESGSDAKRSPFGSVAWWACYC
jgi:hypothetical protein